jgi:biopolymer transport protein ExbD
MNTIGTKLLGSQKSRHHINCMVHWLKISFIPTTITLEEKVSEQVCEQVLEINIEATGQAKTKVKASEETSLTLALNAKLNVKDLEDERIFIKAADAVEQ